MVSAHEAPPDPEWDMIAFQTKSWGRPVTQWQFTPEYGGYWGENVTEGGSFNSAYTLAFHTLEADASRYQALENIVRRLPSVIPDAEDCTNMMTDQPYGTIRMTRGATTTEIAWNSGCLDEEYVAFVALLREANDMVSGWGRAEPVNRTEDFAS